MPNDLITFGLAFIEGFALIISPCILPILPIILSGSLTGSKSRPLGIIVGFIITFTLVTLFSRALIQYSHISQDTLRNISFALLLLLGLIMFSTYLTEKFTSLTGRFANVGSSIHTANDAQGGFFSGVLFGGLVGIIWTPCAGPILAAVIVQAVVQHTTFASVLVVLAFGIGAGLPMLLIAMIGRRIMDKFSFIRGHTTLFRKLLGLIIIATVIYLFYSSGATLSYAQTQNKNSPAPTSLVNGLEKPYPAPEIAGIEAWINSAPLNWNSLKGKVVLIDFWTYSCINCIRTLPYLRDWYAKYHKDGLEIIGIHSPEFEFEHDLNNVRNAVIKDQIRYPVALDNHFGTWQNFKNEYWPAHYLINKEGQVVYQHFGEGEYDVTENNIRYLLGLNGAVSPANPEGSYFNSLTPETYFGYSRADNFSSPEAVVKNKSVLYSYPANLDEDKWALQGTWFIYPDKIAAPVAGASIKLHFRATKVYAVMGTTGKPVSVQISLNDKPLKTIEITQHQLYTLVNLDQEGEGLLEITAKNPGLEMYTFTFGN